MSELTVVPNAERLAQVAAARFTDLACAAIAERGRFVAALSGGSTPEPTYRLLAEAPHAATLDWSRVEVFWGDERCVPPDHPDSNYRMARRALLDHVEIPDSQVHRIQGELPPHEAAESYRAELEAVLGERGRFDLILLGLGSDGHTASLFPGTTAVQERRRDVVATHVDRLGSWRVTLTVPVINDARHVIFLVSGAAKANALARVRAGERARRSRASRVDSVALPPAALVHPEEGTLTWIVDQGAADALPIG